MNFVTFSFTQPYSTLYIFSLALQNSDRIEVLRSMEGLRWVITPATFFLRRQFPNNIHAVGQKVFRRKTSWECTALSFQRGSLSF
uniref:Uncharacterized protein n=1 Tax=Anguilla anguilla TaxID=7936 RepID=A0A0E9U7S2_ANGAN